MFLYINYLEEKDGLLQMKRHRSLRLPENFILCDFSPKENLIELEDQTSGERVWIRTIDLLKRDLRTDHEYQVMKEDQSALVVKFETLTVAYYGKYCYVIPVFKKIGELDKYDISSRSQKGICRVCGCSEDNACYNPQCGSCSWVDETETLCSHCHLKAIRFDPNTIRPILK